MEKLCFFIAVALLSINCFAVCLAKRALNSTTDEEALLAFKIGIIWGPANIFADNWSKSTSICNWNGVSCSRKWQRVTALNISGFGFSGTISPHLGNLTFLSSLDISSKNFMGIIPRELSQLRLLKEINVGFNRLVGEVPSWFGTLPELHHILLHNNNFSGGIPPSLLYNNSKLQTMVIEYNFLNGNIPQEIANLSTLEILYLRFNRFTDSIPSCIFNISSLIAIDISGNILSGRLPEDICDDIPNLEVLALAKNELYGQILSNLYKCRYLQKLALSYNHFSKGIPIEIGSLIMLKILYIGRNDLIGKIYSLSELCIIIFQDTVNWGKCIKTNTKMLERNISFYSSLSI